MKHFSTPPLVKLDLGPGLGVSARQNPAADFYAGGRLQEDGMTR